MFQMFGFGGVKCPRCEHKNDGQSGYCQHCGLTLGAPRSEPVLRDNRWVPGDDELAVYFGVNALSGIFTKTLRVPATTRASSSSPGTQRLSRRTGSLRGAPSVRPQFWQ